MNVQNTDMMQRDCRNPRWWLPIMLAGSAALVWLIRYAARFGLHLGRPPQWAAHFDQKHYIASARAFAHGDLSAAQHWYPLAYSLIAAPFAWLIPNEPFFLPDLAFFVATAVIFARVMRRLGIGAPAAILLLLLGDMAIGRVARLWTEPWTTSLSAPLIWGLIERVLTIVDLPEDRAPPSAGAMLSLGMLAAALPLARPTDGLLAIVAVLSGMAMLWRQRRWQATGVGWVVLGGLALAIPYALLYLAIYGAHESEYMRDAAHQGFAFADLPWKAYVIVVTAAPWFPASPSLLEGMPWVAPGCAGLALAWLDGSGRARTALTVIALLAVPYCAVFLAYTDLQPPGLWAFSNAHYFKWLFPLLAVGSWLWLRELGSWRGARRALVALVVVLLPAFVRPLPVAVADTVPARMLMFRGATDRIWDSAYFSRATLVDQQGSMINVGRFHQIPDAYGERALAVSRLFAGPSVRNDPGEPAPYRSAQQPYARYATRLSLGIPCWVRSAPGCSVPAPGPTPGAARSSAPSAAQTVTRTTGAL